MEPKRHHFFEKEKHILMKKYFSNLLPAFIDFFSKTDKMSNQSQISVVKYAESYLTLKNVKNILLPIKVSIKVLSCSIIQKEVL